MSVSSLRIDIVTAPAGAWMSPTEKSLPFSSPMGVTTAAVPQAKASAISPDATPSLHSSMDTLRSSTRMPRSRASCRMLERVMPSRMLPDRAGVTMRPSP